VEHVGGCYGIDSGSDLNDEKKNVIHLGLRWPLINYFNTTTNQKTAGVA
jgi:hypothetical protein